MAFYKSPAAKKFKPPKTSAVGAAKDRRERTVMPRLPDAAETSGPRVGWKVNDAPSNVFSAADITGGGPGVGGGSVTPIGTFGAASAPGPTGEGQTQSAFGNRIAPGMYGEAWNNPDALIREYFRHAGVGTRGGLYASALDQADNLGILWLLTQNQEAPQDYGNFIDWTGEYMGNQLTPGGESYSSDDIFNAIFGTVGNESSPLRNYLANPGLNAADQVGNVGSTLNKGLETAMPDIVRAAVLARVRELGDDFQALRLRGTGPNGEYSGATPFTEYLMGRDDFFGGFGG